MKALIVGAGPGGLTSAINLAGLGLDVTVVEKAAVPGGRMRGLTFGDQGEYQVDTGPTILQLPQVLERIFRRSGLRIEDYLDLKRLPVNTRIYFWDGSHLDTTWDQEQMAKEVGRLNPALVPAYQAWFAENRAKYQVAYGTFMAHRGDSLNYYNPFRMLPTVKFKPWQNLYTQLDRTFHDDRFNYAFSYAAKYLGLHPTTCSSVFSVIPFIELEFGVWQVLGGFRHLSRQLMKAAQDLGAKFRMLSPVKQVLVEHGKAIGVELEGGERLLADVVVVNADLPYAATTLVEPKWREGTRLSDATLEKAKYSCSAFMMFLGLDTVYRDQPHHLIYLSDAVKRTDLNSLEDLTPDLEDPPFYVVNANASDPEGAPAGHSALYVLVPCPNTHLPQDWERIKAELTAKVPGWLEKVGLKDVASHIKAQHVFTAQTWRDDFNVHRGAIFNLSHGWMQLGPMRPKVRSPDIEDLFWVGGGTHPGSGLLTIIEAANIAASYIADRLGKPFPSWPHVPPPGSLPTSDDQS